LGGLELASPEARQDSTSPSIAFGWSPRFDNWLEEGEGEEKIKNKILKYY